MFMPLAHRRQISHSLPAQTQPQQQLLPRLRRLLLRTCRTTPGPPGARGEATQREADTRVPLGTRIQIRQMAVLVLLTLGNALARKQIREQKKILK